MIRSLLNSPNLWGFCIMLPIRLLPPTGFAVLAVLWAAIMSGWVAVTIWVDRDARDRFGRSTVWKAAFVALGVALVFGAYNWGMRLLEALSLLLLFLVLSYIALRASSQPTVFKGPLGVVTMLLAEVGKVLGMTPFLGRAGGSARGSRAEPVVLLKKDGSMYGKQDTKRLDRETSTAIDDVRNALTDAIVLRATDIHVEPRGRDVHLRCRIDGLLQPLMTISGESGRAFVSAVKVIADMDIAERRRPQDGTFAVMSGGTKFDVRVNSSPTKGVEKLAIRLLDPSGGVVAEGLSGLGLREGPLEKLRAIVHRPHGMLIVCGPTGSGKTTTSYAALREIDGFIRNVITIEDPIEYQLENATQIAVNTAAGLTFADILRSVLRQDPDVILLGEIRDKETAEIAMQAALTGHFVFTTLHANDAPTTVTRLIDIGIDTSLIQSAVSAVLAQRLLRVLCNDCKEAYEPSAEECQRYSIPGHRVSTLYRPKGCPACQGSGYRGRTGVYELMVLDGPMRQLLVGKPSIEAIRTEAARQGVKSLRREAVYKVANGVTSLEEVDRAIGEGEGEDLDA
jgi:type II secretory ATPase GspE/PulE/Tfp pilus assembly ATPase PilB-like protein